MINTKLKFVQISGIVSCLMLLTSCAGTQLEQVHYTDKLGVNIVSNLQNGESYMMAPTTFDERTCRGPAPDVLAALSESGGFALFGESAGINESFSAESLGGRSPEVLVTRELMARLCELTSNIDLSNAEVLKIYADAIDKITDMVKTVGVEQGSVVSGSVENATQETVANLADEPAPSSQNASDSD